MRNEDVTPRLGLLVIGDGLFATHPLPATGTVVVGRSPSNEVFIDHPSVSRRHAMLHIGAQLTIEDLGSANGTRVRNASLAPGERVVIVPGELLEVGSTMLIVQQRAQPIRRRRTWSHEYFEARLEEECARGESTSATFAVVHMRSDPGAPADAIEATMAEELRLIDIVGSYAPGQYEVLLGETQPAEARAVTKRIIDRLEREGLAVHTGIATFPMDGRDPDSLIACANTRARGGKEPLEPAPLVVPEGPMQSLRKLVERIAVGNISVLIMGETGVGKEIMAESIHRLSPRAQHPFLRLNCAALSESLLESELFGHERGAFTGAVGAKPGLLETADRGTVFLDEIGELPMPTQVKLLRVLEERLVLRVGGLKPRAIDVRFLAATNRDLEAEATRGAFRQDLYFRLNGISLSIPPLRERVAEIEDLAHAFIAGTCKQNGRRPPRLAAEALALLKQYSWPGNIRELRNMMERSVLLCSGDVITLEQLSVEKMRALRVEARPARVDPLPEPSLTATAELPGEELDFTRESRALERRRIIDAMMKASGNQSKAAKMLGISRRTLLSKLDVHGLPRPRKRRTV